MRDLVDDIARTHLRDVRVKDEFLAAICPFHKGGQERRPSFWVNRSEGNWGCFSCHAGGPDIESLLVSLGASTIGLTKQLEEAKHEAMKRAERERILRQAKEVASFKAKYILPEALLGVFDQTPTELIEDGYDEKVLIDNDVGYDRERNRITYGIRDVYGNLCGISGRQPDGMTPKYKIYDGWHVVNGERYPGELGESFPGYSAGDIKNHIWGCHTFYEDLLKSRFDELIIVEGYKARLWLVQNNWLSTGALQGSSMTGAQERLIRTLGPDVWIFLDNNDAGRRGTEIIAPRLATGGQHVYAVSYPEYCPEWAQPDDLDPDEIEQALRNAKRVAPRGGRHARMARQQES